MWNGKQLIPAELGRGRYGPMQTSNGSDPASDWDQGYGYQFWRCRHGAYRGDGAFGQYCVVLPEEDAVIVITSGVKDMQGVLDVVWDKLLPAFRPSATDEPGASEKLASRLKALTLRPEDGAGKPAPASRRKFNFPANYRKLESIRIEAGDDGDTLVARFDGVDRRIPCGRGSWKKSRAAYANLAEQPMAATGAWTGDDTFAARICATETPFIYKISFKFAGDEVRYQFESNVALAPTRQPPLVGKAE